MQKNQRNQQQLKHLNQQNYLNQLNQNQFQHQYIEKLKSNPKKLPRLFFQEPNLIILSYWVPGRYQPRRFFTFDINFVPKWNEIDDPFVSSIFHAFVINNTSVWRIPTSRKKFVIPNFKKSFTNFKKSFTN